MKFFIAMQNELYEQQICKQILSCPQKDASGNIPHYYARMIDLSKGDKVFHYVNGNIVAIGTVINPTVSILKVEDNDYYFNTDIHYETISTPLHIRSYWENIQKILPAEYSPFQRNGHDNGGFLYPCDENLASLLMMKIALLNQAEPVMQEILETEAKIQSKMRLGHQAYKDKLLQLWNNECAICKINIPQLLRASHAKPWRDSNQQERTDPHNGLLLCAHHDALFDKGFLSFNQNGGILLSNELLASNPSVYAIDPSTKIQLFEENAKYLLWHQSYVFKKH